MNNTAQTLFSQIGPRTFAMLGAHGIVATEAGLQFSIKGCKAGNKLVITLAADDTYTVELWKVRGADFHRIAGHSGVYVDSLHLTIETLTGLRTRL